MTTLAVVALTMACLVGVIGVTILIASIVRPSTFLHWYAVPRDGAGPRVGPFFSRTGAAVWCAAHEDLDYTVARGRRG